MRSGRLVAVVALALVLAAAGWADRRPVERDEAPFPEVPPYLMPVADPASTLTSTWYCAGAGSKEDGLAEGSLVIANAGGDDVRGTVTVFPLGGEPVASPVDVPRRGRVSLSLRELVAGTESPGATYAAALVELRGGDVAAELTVRGPDGTDTAACSSSASGTWHFPWGVTTVDAKERLLLFNPFPGDAIVDVAAATDEGRRDPEALQGLVVPGRSVALVDVSSEVLRQRHVALSVVARSGRLVANRVQALDGSIARQGLTLTLGAPAAGTEWRFAAGYVAEGTNERLHVYNPGEDEAEVDVTVLLDDPEVNGVPAPFEVTIPGRDYVTLDYNEEERIPAEIPHATVVTSVNGVPVVAERVVAEFDPSAREGIAATMGSRMAAERWLLPAGAATDEIDEVVTVFNPGSAATEVRIVRLDGGDGAIDGLEPVEVPAGQRRAIRLGEHVDTEELPLVVEADTPVVVERRLAEIDDLGVASTLGIPLAG